ncbi:MAG: DM13 domain-containing protein, partial [Cyclobacteriaceae bacterium]
ETVAILWKSDNSDIITIDAAGNASAVGPGITTLTASAGDHTAQINVSVESDIAEPRTGMLRGTGYDIEGRFTLSEDENGDLILKFDDASIDNGAPGPYFYLTNQENNISGGINLGKSRNGSFSINVSDSFPDVKLNTYQHVMVWCEPFNVRLGIGTFDN